MKSKYMFVYSKHLRNYLMDNNQEFICVAKSVSTNEKFWLFERTDMINNLMDEYDKTYAVA